MSTKSKYKENNFSPENLLNSNYKDQNNLNEDERINIKHLLKRIHDERKQERKNSVSVGVVFLSIILIFSFVQN